MNTFKELRESSGMTPTQFAEYFNINLRNVHRWEKGDRKCPDYVLELMKYKLENEKKKGKL